MKSWMLRLLFGVIATSLLLVSIAPTGPVTARSQWLNSDELAADAAILIAQRYIEQNVVALGLLADDVAEMQLRDHYRSEHNGVTHLYFQQQHDGIDVYNALLTINVSADGEVFFVGNQFVADLARSITNEAVAISPETAVAATVQALNLDQTAPWRQLTSAKGQNLRQQLSDGGLASEPITVQLIYQPLADGTVRLTWDVTLNTADLQNYWRVRVDTATGRVLDQLNHVIHDDWSPPLGVHLSPPALAPAPLAPAPLMPSAIIDRPASAPNDYLVFAVPVEDPGHTTPAFPADGRTIENNPAHATASPLGWHNDGTNSYTITRGNNANAYEDGNNSGFSPDCGATLDCNFPLDFAMHPDTYESAAIANLFFWNNIVHDIFYQYGFDEAGGNFQEDNFSLGGVGSDSVEAEAQDGSGDCNANFLTLPDGSNGRMQMFLCANDSPPRDGDFDNGVIAHEYGHGISTRLTGGPGNASCLNNDEQGGEGWSDWVALVMTIEAGDTGADSRGIATFLFAQAPDGPGIRPQPYSTNMAINNATYATISGQAIPHGVGWVWATMIWDMTWDLIDLYGFDPDLYAGSGGNNVAMQLVIDGLKMQACSPGFVDARDAILAADLANNAGANQCLIWGSFARRGLGFSADQGSTGNIADGTEAFDLPPTCEFLAAAPASEDICVGDTAVYAVSIGAAYSSPVTMGVTGEPAGVTASFTPNPVVTVPGSTSLSISDTAAAAPGAYTLNISGTDSVTTTMTTATLNLFDVAPGTTTLSAPADGTGGVATAPTLTWLPVAGASSYLVEIATDAAFTTIVYSGNETGSSHDVALDLAPDTTHYWRVTALNPCGNGTASAVWSFSTANVICRVVNTSIPDGGSGSLSDSLLISSNGTILDLNVSIEATHSWVGDLLFSLEHTTTGTTVDLIDRPGFPSSTFGCGGNDITALLDDEAATAVEDECAAAVPTIDGTFSPSGSLASFDGESLDGEWKLTVTDNAGGDIGTLVEWCLAPEVAVTAAPNIAVSPTALTGTVAAETAVTLPLTINNSGDADLHWSLSEDNAVTLQIDDVADRPAVAGPVTLSLDDGGAENSIGDMGQLMWLNRFTPDPADFPIALDEIWVMFGSNNVLLNTPIDLVVYEDTDGDSNPGTGANHIITLPDFVKANDLTSWSTYTLVNPIMLNGPGDVLIGAINRYGFETYDDFPAAIDETASQGRSWVGTYQSGDAPNPPPLPADEQWGLIDSFGFPGNWMIRGFGSSESSCTMASDIPWLNLDIVAGTTIPSGSSTVMVTLDATGLAIGDYAANLCVISDDPDEALIVVPVTLTVEPGIDKIFMPIVLKK